MKKAVDKGHIPHTNGRHIDGFVRTKRTNNIKKTLRTRAALLDDSFVLQTTEFYEAGKITLSKRRQQRLVQRFEAGLAKLPIKFEFTSDKRKS